MVEFPRVKHKTLSITWSHEIRTAKPDLPSPEFGLSSPHIGPFFVTLPPPPPDTNTAILTRARHSQAPYGLLGLSRYCSSRLEARIVLLEVE